MEDNIITAVL